MNDAPPPPPGIPAGWYPDPENAAQQRYWDGMTWTSHTAPAVVPPPPPTAPVAPAAPAAHAAPVNVVARGHNGTITFDGVFVTIVRTGMMARMTVGKGEKRIPVSSIAAVQWKPPGALMNGFISFAMAGGNERQSRFGSQTSSATHDENSVIVTSAQKASFVVLREAIESEIAARYRR